MTRTLEELREYLVGEWKFDNNFLDTSGNGNHGVPTDIEWKPTSRGLKPYFNGSSSYIKTDTIVSQDMNEFSIALKLCPTSYDLPSNPQAFAQISSGYDTIRLEFADVIFLWVADYDKRDALRGNAKIELSQHTSIIITFNNGYVEFYIDGIFIGDDTSTVEYIKKSNYEFYIGSRDINDNFFKGYYDSLSFYSTVLSADEVLNLYNSTKHAYGVRPAERSFTHRLQPEVDDSTVAAFDMSTKNADGTLMDLSGNSNHGTINGAVRSGGYFTDGMRFDGVDDYVDCGNNSVLEFQSGFTLSVLYYQQEYGNQSKFITKYNLFGYKLDNASDDTIRFTTIGIKDYFSGQTTSLKKWHLLECVFTNDYDVLFYIDGIYKQKVTGDSPAVISDDHFTIGGYIGKSLNFNGIIPYSNVYNIELSESQIKSNFNSLANLPLYTFNASKYPTSSGWTALVPYSSMSITSGEFSFTDSGQLQCDSAGSFSLRNAHEFDGSEYIKLTIDGVEYAGTGSVTQGNVTVAITQSSTKIDVDMGTSDLIDGIDIQFREPVE